MNIEKPTTKTQPARPKSKQSAGYYRVIVRPDTQFTSFRIQDVGQPGGLMRVAGRRSNGSWATQSWLVSKTMAHPDNGILIPDHDDARDLFGQLPHTPKLQSGNIYSAAI